MKKKTVISLTILLFLASLGLTLYPVISNYVNQKYASQIHTAYQEVIEQADVRQLAEAKAQALAYNQALVPGASEAYTQQGLEAAAKAYETLLNMAGSGIMGYVEIPKIQINLPIYHGTETDTLERGIGHLAAKAYETLLNMAGSGIMGYVEIPKIQINLPIYHGTETDTLERGIGHLLGSSLPVGGESTHTILSGHSGMASQKMFTDLEQLAKEDVFYLRVLQETLAYQVSSIRTVLPHDTSLLSIEEGADLCTLITCTPYGVNSHRLLVTGSRIPYEEAETIQADTQDAETTESTWEEKYMEGILYGILAALWCQLPSAAGNRLPDSLRGSRNHSGRYPGCRNYRVHLGRKVHGGHSLWHSCRLGADLGHGISALSSK